MENKTQNNWYSEDSCVLDEFITSLSRHKARQFSLNFAIGIEKDIPIFDCSSLKTLFVQENKKYQVLSEWFDILKNGAGVIALKNAYDNTEVIDKASEVFQAIITEEKKQSGGGGDHFAKSGANDRIWNALEKLCVQSPQIFAQYYANEMLDAVAQAWLGPNYQTTSQINVVRPGGTAQNAHRDYHLGFQSEKEVLRYPKHVHQFSSSLTLQGAVAHCDMPIESGATKLLPFSQNYGAGYIACKKNEFCDFFEKNYVQLPLNKGDAVFFNPALFHAAGSNITQDVIRMANLLQISSAYGKAMESIDRLNMCKILYPVLVESKNNGTLTKQQIQYAINSCADGYSFPTNLDLDPPVGGNAPQTQNALFQQALSEDWSSEFFNQKLTEQAQRK